MDQIRIERKAFVDEAIPGLMKKVDELYQSAHELAVASQKMMEQLITPVVHVN
jgi:hypothetical protein